MSGGTLKVDPAVLGSAGTSFGQAADALGSLQADAPLSDAAAAVPSLRRRCPTARVSSARTYGPRYEKRDQAAADAIKKGGSASAAGG